MTFISELSSRFANLPSAEVDREIEAALGPACEAFRVDFASVWQRSLSAPDVMTPTHVHVYAGGDGDPVARPGAEAFPWCGEQMRLGRTVAFSSLEELPVDAAVDREAYRRLGVRSNLSLPLSVGGEMPFGMLTFSTLQMDRDWPDPAVDGLRLVAQIIASALARKRHDEILRESAERLSLAADAADAGLWTLNHRTGVFWLTERARTILGFPSEERNDLEHLASTIHPEDRELFRADLDRSARHHAPFGIEFRVVLHAEGRVRWLAMRGRSHPNAPIDTDYLMGAVIDITGRKRVEAALRKSEARLAASAELVGLAFYELNFQDQSVFIDDRFRDVFGLPRDREEGLAPLDYWAERIHPDDRPGVLSMLDQVKNNEADRVAVEYRYLHPAHGEKWVQHVTRVTGRDASGLPITTFGALHDITEGRRREEALRESNAEITRLKDKLQAESDYLKAEIGEIRPGTIVTGESPAILRALRLVEKVAPTGSSVLIHGETGTGKELIAQAVHNQSPRKTQVMVSLNCAALPSGLVESELFGREKGAFTGALTRQIGRFELADRSTLFLDEIGELSLEVQAKLLRVLESGEFERLGNPRTLRADVRLIAATNRDLAEEVRKGRFREDLYYRLNVFPIRVPPLRERADDIPLLVWAFLEEFSKRMGKRITQVSRTTMEALQRQRWPGNVRELRNVIEHAAILATGDTLKVDGLGAPLVGVAVPKLIDSERELILRALENTRWRIKGAAGAAKTLGLNPSTLYSRMKKLGLKARRAVETPSR